MDAAGCPAQFKQLLSKLGLATNSTVLVRQQNEAIKSNPDVTKHLQDDCILLYTCDNVGYSLKNKYVQTIACNYVSVSMSKLKEAGLLDVGQYSRRLRARRPLSQHAGWRKDRPFLQLRQYKLQRLQLAAQCRNLLPGSTSGGMDTAASIPLEQIPAIVPAGIAAEGSIGLELEIDVDDDEKADMETAKANMGCRNMLYSGTVMGNAMFMDLNSNDAVQAIMNHILLLFREQRHRLVSG